MPVRKVPKNYRSLTGLVPHTRTSSMTAFESSLERDFLLLLDFDPEVAFYDEQPVTLVSQDAQGRRRRHALARLRRRLMRLIGGTDLRH